MIRPKHEVECFVFKRTPNSEIETKCIHCIIEECYLAARGTDKLDTIPKWQLYWRGRADASNDVRKLHNVPFS